MAIIQISKVQHRRGLKIDLPSPLNEAEFGWTTDSRELFIGNGPIFPGNTQVITNQTSPGIQQYVYREPNTYQNILSLPNAVTSTTGFLSGSFGGVPTDELIPDPRFTTSRSYQEKFDERTSVKDYGATGNIADDDTGAIWRAATDLYSELDGRDVTDERRRRVLFFPAGIYRIRQFAPLFPFSHWVGEGKGKTIIFFDNENLGIGVNDQAVIDTVDSLGQSGTAMGTNTPVQAIPTDITVEGISFVSNTSKTTANVGHRQVALLSRANRVRFQSCEFKFDRHALAPDKWVPGDSEIDAPIAVFFSKTTNLTATMADITFDDCETDGAAFGFNFIDEIKNISIQRHEFRNHFHPVKSGFDAVIDAAGFRLETNVGSESPNNIKTSFSFFIGNENNGLLVTNASGPAIISTYNYYDTPSDALASAVVFDTTTTRCVSSFDTFADTTPFTCDDINNSLTPPRVDNQGTLNTVMNAQDFFEIPADNGIKGFTICGDLVIRGNLIIVPSLPATAAAGGILEVTRISYPSTSPVDAGNALVLDYALRQAGTNDLLRTGTFRAIYNEDPSGTLQAVSFDDDYVEVNGPPPNPITMAAISNDASNELIIQVTYNVADPGPTISFTVKTLSI